jgi:NAD(P)-dependent dehydrogenase (short-subunit alcohol dehydrogenase family)
MNERAPLLRDRVCVLSGVGPGLGRAVALAFAREGAALVLACRTEATAAAMADEVRAAGGRAVGVRCDVTAAADREALVAAAVAAHGGIDILVNNAFATGRHAPIEGSDLARGWRAPFEVNVFATLQLCQAVLPILRERGGGSIVNIGTLASRRPEPGLAAYGAAKAALLAASRSLAAEVGRHRIRVNSVVPGHIDGPNLRVWFRMEAERRGTTEEAIYAEVAAGGVMGHIPTSEEVAETVLFLASDMASAVTGQAIDVNCGQWFH